MKLTVFLHTDVLIMYYVSLIYLFSFTAARGSINLLTYLLKLRFGACYAIRPETDRAYFPAPRTCIKLSKRKGKWSIKISMWKSPKISPTESS